MLAGITKLIGIQFVFLYDLPWHNIWSAGNPVEVCQLAMLNEYLSLLVYVMYNQSGS